jgi:hypothetical protein
LSNSSDSVWICWGDAAQTNQPAYTLDGTVWSEDYRLVLHMGDSQDASTNQAAGTSSNVAFDGGRIGDAGRFNGTSSMLTFGHSNVLKPASQITISAWVKPSGLAGARFQNIYRKDDSTYRHLLAFQEIRRHPLVWPEHRGHLWGAGRADQRRRLRKRVAFDYSRLRWRP